MTHHQLRLAGRVIIRPVVLPLFLQGIPVHMTILQSKIVSSGVELEGVLFHLLPLQPLLLPLLRQLLRLLRLLLHAHRKGDVGFYRDRSVVDGVMSGHHIVGSRVPCSVMSVSV